MKLLLEDIDENGERGDVPLPGVPAVVTPEILPKIREGVR